MRNFVVQLLLNPESDDAAQLSQVHFIIVDVFSFKETNAFALIKCLTKCCGA